MKPGRVVIMLNGRFAGRKAVVVKSYDEGSQDRPYGHALVAGIDKFIFQFTIAKFILIFVRYPLKVTKRMGKKKVAKRIRIRPFMKVTSLQHVLPTRCTFDAEFDKTLVNKESVKEPKKKRCALANIKKELETHYKTGKSKWLFTKLRF